MTSFADGARGNSLAATIEDAALNTGAHGIANVYRTKSVPRKSFWIALVLAALGMCLVFIFVGKFQPINVIVKLCQARTKTY